MGDDSVFACGCAAADERAGCWAGVFGRRAVGAVGRAWQRGGVHCVVRALSPGAVPVLPIDRARRHRCLGRASVDVSGRSGGVAAGAAQRAGACVVVSHCSQRGDLDSAPAWRGGGALRSLRTSGAIGGRSGCGSPAFRAHGLRSVRVAGAERGALLMRELSGLSHDEIAVALDTSAGAAKRAIFDARRGLAEFAEGRAMCCEEIQRCVSDGDRRVLRGRRLRAHVRDCAGCAAFSAAISAGRGELQALVPALPPVVSAAMLTRLTHCLQGREQEARRRHGGYSIQPVRLKRREAPQDRARQPVDESNARSSSGRFGRASGVAPRRPTSALCASRPPHSAPPESLEHGLVDAGGLVPIGLLGVPLALQHAAPFTV
jgi:hypothetical protein